MNGYLELLALLLMIGAFFFKMKLDMDKARRENPRKQPPPDPATKAAPIPAASPEKSPPPPAATTKAPLPETITRKADAPIPTSTPAPRSDAPTITRKSGVAAPQATPAPKSDAPTITRKSAKAGVKVGKTANKTKDSKPNNETKPAKPAAGSKAPKETPKAAAKPKAPTAAAKPKAPKTKPATSSKSDAKKIRLNKPKTTTVTTSSNKPAVSVDMSVQEDTIICLICGKGNKLLKAHLKRSHQMEPEEYRKQFNLDDSYPMTPTKSAAATKGGTAKG